MTGYLTRVLPPAMRLGFVAAGVMMMLPHQASSLMLWINAAGVALGAALLALEFRKRKEIAYVRA